jgi:aspartate aminotransferase
VILAITLSQRVKAVKPSATLAITAKAKSLKAQGKKVIGLAAGEPDFDTPAHIKQAGIDAINNGQTRYTAVAGTIELRQAIVDKFLRDNKLSYTPDQVLVSGGGKQSFYNLCQALLNKGDEVIIPAPYWVSYPDMVILADATPVVVKTEMDQQFKITADQLQKSITKSTRLLVLNSPSNPTGVCYTRAELVELGKVLALHPEIIIATDDMYEHILWSEEPFVTIAQACPELYDRTLTMNGVSKAYAMTGWRIGYAAGPLDLIKAMTKIQSQSTSNPCSISQAASLTALSADQSCIAEMLIAFKQRHDYVVKKINTIDGLSALESQGAFYCFFNAQPLIDSMDNIADDVQLCDYILDKAEVALVPGTAFGSTGYLRLSFATSMENLEEALERLKNLFN